MNTLGRITGFFTALIIFLSLAYTIFLKHVVSYPPLLVMGILGTGLYMMLQRGEDHVVF